MKQQLIICKGLPASGKSTWAKQWVLEDHTNRIRVNRDDIRNMLGPYWVPSRESLVTLIEEDCIINALNNKYSVVIDATNFKNNFTSDWWEMYLKHVDAELVIQDFTNVSIEECIRRDELRENGVGRDAIMNMVKKYLNDKI